LNHFWVLSFSLPFFLVSHVRSPRFFPVKNKNKNENLFIYSFFYPFPNFGLCAAPVSDVVRYGNCFFPERLSSTTPQQPLLFFF